MMHAIRIFWERDKEDILAPGKRVNEEGVKTVALLEDGKWTLK